MKSAFAERFGELLRQKDIKPTDLAEELGLTHKTVYDYIKGNIYPSTKMVNRIADLLGVSIDYLFGRVDEPTDFLLMEDEAELKKQIFFINESYRRMNEGERSLVYNLVRLFEEGRKKGKDGSHLRLLD